MPSVRTLRTLKLSRVDLVPKGSNPGAHIALFKEAPESSDATESISPESSGPTNSKENPMSQTATEATATEEVEATEATETENTEATTEVTETTEAAETTEATAEVATPEPALAGAGVEKSAPESITKAEADAIRKENADLAAKVTKMEADARRATFIAKAEEDFGTLGNSVAIGEMLMKAEDAFGENEVNTLNTMLKALTEQAVTGDLFKQFAKGDADATDRETELEKAAAERVEKGESKTIEQARVAVMDANPALRPDNTTARS